MSDDLPTAAAEALYGPDGLDCEPGAHRLLCDQTPCWGVGSDNHCGDFLDENASPLERDYAA
jgi:hypothetical protein